MTEATATRRWRPWTARVPRWVVVTVFLAGAAHSALYAFSFPPWAIEDEQQHVDYTWKLAFDHRVPHIEDELDASIVESVVGTERWRGYRMGTPAGPRADQLGLQGRSYAAYHPPLHYLLTAPIAQLIGDRALVLMYALRLVSVVLAGVASVLVAHLAGRWAARRCATSAALVAGLSLAGLPALADSGGRFNTDVAAAVVVAGAALAAHAWSTRPDARRAWVVGVILGTALLTRETAIVAVVPVAVAVVAVRRRGGLQVGHLARMAVPVGVALAVLIAVLDVSTGSLDGGRAFLDLYGVPFPDTSAADVLDLLLHNALFPYGDWSDVLTIAGVLMAAAVSAGGVVLAVRQHLRAATAAAWGAVALQLVILLVACGRGLNIPTARLLLPSYPLVAAWLGAAFSASPRRLVVALPAVLSLTLGAAFFLSDFAPRYPFRLG